MLGLAKRVGARFLLTSTSEVYGDPLQHPQVETYWGNVNPIGTFFFLVFLVFDFRQGKRAFLSEYPVGTAFRVCVFCRNGAT